MKPLKQSTAKTIVIGPFLDSADGVTPETGLSLTSSDVRLSKSGGAFAAKNDATAPVHLENGFYSCVLNTTDTNTLGDMTLAVFAAGAVPVFHEIEVFSASAFALNYGTDGDAVVNLKRLNIVNDTSAPAVNFENSAGDAFELDSNGGTGIGLNISGAVKGVKIVGETAEGIDIDSAGVGIDIDSSGAPGMTINSSGTYGLDIGGGSSSPAINISQASSAPLINLVNSGAGKGIYINAGGDAINLDSDSANGLNINANSSGIRVNGNNGLEIIAASDGINVLAQGFGMLLAAVNGDAFRADSTNGKDINAAEIDTIDANVDAIVAKLPSGTISDLALTDQVDGVTLFNIFELAMAMVNGRYEIDNPSAGKITFFKRDNTTVLTTVTVSDVNRTRDV